MAGLIDKPTDTPEPPAVEAAPPLPPIEDGVSAPDDASRLCVNCAGLLAEGQDWCLECGTAQPGRLGSKPGWRPALTIVALTVVLAVGAVAAAYAALSSDAERQASAPPPPSAQPVVPTPPVQTTPAPVDETPSVPAPTDDVETPKTPKAPKSDAPDPAPAPAPAPAPTPSSNFDSGSGGTDTSTEDEATTKPEPVDKTIALSADAASTFDPLDRSGGLSGDPADAIDGRARTEWEAPVGADGRVDIGLLVSLEKAQEIAKVRLQAGTPGFNVELYGSKLGTAPDEAPGQTAYWKKLDATRDFGTDERLEGGKGKYRYVLLWFTEQPADTKVMIPEVTLERP